MRKLSRTPIGKIKIMNISAAVGRFLEHRSYPGITLKAVLFDMDGVLFDSMKNHTLAWYKAVSDMGIPCSQEEFYQYEGATGKWTVNHIFERVYGREATEDEIEEIYTEKSRYFNELPETGAMPGVKDLLAEVVKRGLIPVLVTGSGQRSLLKRLDREFPTVFKPEYMVTAFDVKQGKPAPEPYLRGLEKAGVKPEEALVVENAPLGVQAAAAAGIFTVAVNTGPIPDRQLHEAGADLVFPDMPAFAYKGFAELCSEMEKSRR